MATDIYFSPFLPTFSGNGLPVANARLYFFYTGTENLAPIYADAEKTTLLPNPVISDGAARYPNIYLDSEIVYRVRETGKNLVPLTADIDPYYPGSAYIIVPSLPEIAAPGGSALVGWKQGPAAAGATNRTVEAKLRERVSVKDFGALGDGVTDDGPAIRLATTYASSIGGAVYFPAGTYLVRPSIEGPGYIGDYTFGPTILYAIQILSNVTWYGDGATIKVADGVSTREDPQNFAVFYTNQAVQKLTWTGIEIDLNSPNNYFSPNPSDTELPQEDTADEPGRYLRYHQAAIFIEGTTGKADDVLIQNMTFRNGNGVSTIICGRVGAAGVGRRWNILDNSFLELGLDTYDHSTIFLWCDDAFLSNNFWRNELIYAPTAPNLSGVNSAVEIHGSNTIVEGNVVDGANRGFFVTENGYGRVQGVIVSLNVLRRIKYCGIDIAFDGSGAVGPGRLIEVSDNIIDMSADDTNVALTTVPTAIQYFGLDSTVAPIESLVIARNEMKRPASVSNRACQGIGISVQAADFGMIDVLDNGASGFTRGAYVVTDTTTTCESINYQRNRFRNPSGGTQVGAPGMTKAGWWMLAQGGTIGRISIDDVEIADTRSTNSWAFGIVVAETAPTTVREFHVSRNTKFDYRLAYANRFSGITDLDLTRMTGVPVLITYTTGGPVSPGNGAGFTAPYPGVGMAGDKLELTYVSGPVDIYPNNPTYFSSPLLYGSAANTVRLWQHNDGPGNADPGTHTIAATNYAS